MRAGPGRAVIRAALPVDLLDDLDREAERRGISVEELVDVLLVEHLPIVLAEEARAQLQGALDLAKSFKSEAARELLSLEGPEDTATPPAPLSTGGATQNLMATQPQVNNRLHVADWDPRDTDLDRDAQATTE